MKMINKTESTIVLDGYGGVEPGGKLYICAADLERAKAAGLTEPEPEPERVKGKRAASGNAQ